MRDHLSQKFQRKISFIYSYSHYDINLELYRSVVYSHITYAAFRYLIYLGFSQIYRYPFRKSKYISTSTYFYKRFDNKDRTFGNRAQYYRFTWITDRALKIALNQALCADYLTLEAKSRSRSHLIAAIPLIKIPVYVSLLSPYTCHAISHVRISRSRLQINQRIVIRC